MRNSLDIFLEALAKRRGEYRGIYIPRYVTLPTPVNAIKNKTLEVYMTDDGNQKMISSVSINVNVSDDDEVKRVDRELVLETINHILKYYGVQ